MPRVRLHLLVNKVRSSDGGEPSETLNDLSGLRLVERFGFDAVYGAWDFDIDGNRSRKGWRELTPPELVQSWKQEDPLPQFFRLRADRAHDPASTPTVDFLSSLPWQLDPAELQTESLRAHWTEARRLVAEGLGERL